MLHKDQLEALSALSYSQNNFNDNRLAFETFGHHFNYNIAVTLANTYVIKGKPAMNADSMASAVRRYKDSNGVLICGYLRVIELNDEVCTLGTRRRDELDFSEIPEHVFSFTIEQAKQRGFLKNRSWQTMPSVMLHKRCLTALLRCFYPDIIGVAHSPEELAEALITDEDEREAIVFEAVAQQKAPKAKVKAYSKVKPKKAPKVKIKVNTNPYPMTLKSVNMTAEEALLKIEEVGPEDLDKLSIELKEYLFGYAFDANPLEHIKRALYNLTLKTYQITIDRVI